MYTVVEEIVERSGTPYFSFKDIDENKPVGAIRLRVETIAYFMRRHRERLVDRRVKRRAVDERLALMERELRSPGLVTV